MTLTTARDQLLDEMPELGFKLTLATVDNSAATVTTTDPRVMRGGTNADADRYRDWHLFIPGAAAANQSRTVTTLSVSATVATITTSGPVYSAGQVTQAAYLLRIPHAALLAAMNDALDAEYLETTTILSEIVDGDVQSTVVTDWTDSSATSSKVTTAANVPFDLKRSLRVLNSGANGHTRSTIRRIPRGRSFYVCAIGRADVGTAKVIVANAADTAIDSFSTTQEDWQFLWKQISPASTDEEIYIEPGGVGASDDSYWGGFGFIRPGNRNVYLPSFITRRFQVQAISRADFAVSGDEGNAELAGSRNLVRLIEGIDYRLVFSDGSANPASVEFLKDYSSYPLFLTGLRSYAALGDSLTTEASTTDCAEDLLVQRTKHFLGQRYEEFKSRYSEGIAKADALREMERTELPQQGPRIWRGYVV